MGNNVSGQMPNLRTTHIVNADGAAQHGASLCKPHNAIAQCRGRSCRACSDLPASRDARDASNSCALQRGTFFRQQIPSSGWLHRMAPGLMRM